MLISSKRWTEFCRCPASFSSFLRLVLAIFSAAYGCRENLDTRRIEEGSA
jgi:hypothetical protein